MTDIQERQDHYEARDRERRELEVKIKGYGLTLFAISKRENEPDNDERFRKAYLQRCELLRQYRRKYGQEAYEQLRDELDEARKTYVKQYEAEEQLESQKDQIKELRQQLSEMNAVANAHAYEIMDVKRRILDELYKFPALELLDVLLELRRKHKKENDE